MYYVYQSTLLINLITLAGTFLFLKKLFTQQIYVIISWYLKIKLMFII